MKSKKKIILDSSILGDRSVCFDYFNISSIFREMGLEAEWMEFPNKESVLIPDEVIILSGQTIRNAFESQEFDNFITWLHKFYQKHRSMSIISVMELFHPRNSHILKIIDRFAKPCRILSPWHYGQFTNIKEYNHDMNTQRPPYFSETSTGQNFFALCRTSIKPEREGRQELIDILKASYDSKNFKLDYEIAISPEDTEKYKNERKTKSFDSTIPIDLYQRCQLDIVCETNSTISEVFYPTEKIYKPLCGEMPFVALASRGYLKGLRNKGFRTFGEIFDESYDEIEDLSDRVNAIGELIKGLSHRDLKSSCRHITRHNRKRFYEIYSTARVLYTKKLKKIIKLTISEH